MTIAKLSILFKKLYERIYNWTTYYPDFILFLLTSSKEPNEKHVVFVGMYMHARIARTSRWIKKKDNRKTILIAKKTVFTPALSNDSFDKTILFRNKWHLLKILKSYGGKNAIIHSFGPPHEAAFEIIKNSKNKKQTVLFDFQDLMISNFGMNPPFAYMKKDLDREKFILNHADGIVAHSLELQSAKKYFGEIKTPKLFFPLYVDNIAFKEKANKVDDELHLVYVGGVHSKFQNKDYFGGLQLYWLVEKLNEQRIHFHIYPAPTNRKEDLLDYIKFDKELAFFQLHKPVSQANLIEEINKYDFGVIPFFHNTNNKLNAKRTYCTTLKLFNYIEAGIPMIIGEDTAFENFLGRRFQSSVSFSYEMFDDVRNNLKSMNYNETLKHIRQTRETYSLETNIQKLLDFYNRLEQ
tara:strand:- start:77 stop:1303 length:1227 start_codon:yes stop_codon:yes gene_type:complete